MRKLDLSNISLVVAVKLLLLLTTFSVTCLCIFPGPVVGGFAIYCRHFCARQATGHTAKVS